MNLEVCWFDSMNHLIFNIFVVLNVILNQINRHNVVVQDSVDIVNKLPFVLVLLCFLRNAQLCLEIAFLNFVICPVNFCFISGCAKTYPDLCCFDLFIEI